MTAFRVLKSMYILAALTIAGCLSNVALAAPAWVSAAWMEPQDTAMAINSPDEYAWRLFVALNWPAKSLQRTADDTKQLGDPGRTVWESWRLVSGKGGDVYLKDASRPADWATAPLDPYCSTTARERFFQQNAILQPAEVRFDVDSSTKMQDEVRMNAGTFEFIQANGLYALAAQQKLFSEGIRDIVFPATAKEIKAEWRIIDPKDASRYHTCSFDGVLYGLTSIHIISKDLPDWFWATFEHIDNKTLGESGNPPEGYRPWLLASSASWRRRASA